MSNQQIKPSRRRVRSAGSRHETSGWSRHAGVLVSDSLERLFRQKAAAIELPADAKQIWHEDTLGAAIGAEDEDRI